MQRHFSTGVQTIVALMEAHRGAGRPTADGRRCAHAEPEQVCAAIATEPAEDVWMDGLWLEHLKPA